MNIDIESIGLLSLILQDSPKDRQFILCIMARSNTVPTRINFHSNTEYPTFYGYSNSRIPLYLMGKGAISNVPREGYAKRLITSSHLSYAETIINRAKNWDIHQKGMSISKFITLDNRTAYKDAEVFLIFRDKAMNFIRDYAVSHRDEISTFLGVELRNEVFKESQPVSALSSVTQVDYSDTASRKGLEKKWDALQTIWAVYISNNKPDKMLVPIGNLTIKDRSMHEVDGIIAGLQKDACFAKWHRGTENYAIEDINNIKLDETYRQTKFAYEEPIKAPEKQIPSKRDLRKRINKIIKEREFGNKEKGFLKFLARDFESKTLEEISQEVSTKDCKHLKGRVEKKIKGTGFSIRTIKAGGWGIKSQYQLEYLPTPANTQQ